MDATGALLCRMYKSVKMESESIVSLMPKVKDRFLITELTASLEGNFAFAKDIEGMMHERGIEPTSPGILTKIGARAGIIANTLIDPSPSHIARLCMGEAEEGARRLERDMQSSSDTCDARMLGYCQRVIEKKRQNAERMEAFL